MVTCDISVHFCNSHQKCFLERTIYYWNFVLNHNTLEWILSNLELIVKDFKVFVRVWYYVCVAWIKNMFQVDQFFVKSLPIEPHHCDKINWRRYAKNLKKGQKFPSLTSHTLFRTVQKLTQFPVVKFIIHVESVETAKLKTKIPNNPWENFAFGFGSQISCVTINFVPVSQHLAHVHLFNVTIVGLFYVYECVALNQWRVTRISISAYATNGPSVTRSSVHFSEGWFQDTFRDFNK